MSWFLRQYDRRIVNVNVNIFVAGMLAIVFTVGVMKILDILWDLNDRLKHLFPDLVISLGGDGVTSGWNIPVAGYSIAEACLTFVVDLFADVIVYYVLHWVANNMPRPAHFMQRPVSAAYGHLTFMKSATLVQFERALLSPILYTIALGIQTYLRNTGWDRSASISVGFFIGICCTRTIHTVYMLWMERRAGRRSAADIVGPDTAASNGQMANRQIAK